MNIYNKSLNHCKKLEIKGICCVFKLYQRLSLPEFSYICSCIDEHLIKMIEQIKQNIKKQIKLHKTTAKKVCDKIGEDRRFIFFLTDKTSLIKIMRIAKAIGCQPGDILNEVTLPKPYDK